MTSLAEAVDSIGREMVTQEDTERIRASFQANYNPNLNIFSCGSCGLRALQTPGSVFSRYYTRALSFNILIINHFNVATVLVLLYST